MEKFVCFLSMEMIPILFVEVSHLAKIYGKICMFSLHGNDTEGRQPLPNKAAWETTLLPFFLHVVSYLKQNIHAYVTIKIISKNYIWCKQYRLCTYFFNA
jgi:hypothetical protein